MPDVSALLVSLVAPVLTPVLAVTDKLDPSPEPEDVKAGYPALFLFLGLLIVIGLLGLSMARHLRRAQSNRDAGLYGDTPVTTPAPAAEQPSTDDAQIRPEEGRDRPGGGPGV